MDTYVTVFSLACPFKTPSNRNPQVALDTFYCGRPEVRSKHAFEALKWMTAADGDDITPVVTKLNSAYNTAKTRCDMAHSRTELLFGPYLIHTLMEIERDRLEKLIIEIDMDPSPVISALDFLHPFVCDGVHSPELKLEAIFERASSPHEPGGV